MMVVSIGSQRRRLPFDALPLSKLHTYMFDLERKVIFMNYNVESVNFIKS